MARIRTLKPEIVQSESLGRVSREARLCFILLMTQADDLGRLRAHSRVLASFLFPFDDDAPGLIDKWLDELEGEGCIRRYIADENHYIDIPKWLKHQKIDHPCPSKLPAFVANSREDSRELAPGPRTLDLGPRKEREVALARSPRPNGSARTKGQRLPVGSPSPEERAWACQEFGWTSMRVDQVAAKYRDHWLAEPGQKGVKLDWAATWRKWCRNELEFARAGPGSRGEVLDFSKF